MVEPALLSTLATVLLLLVIVVSVSIAGQRRKIDVSGADFDVLERLSGPVGWTVGFVLLAMLGGVGAIVAVSDGGFVPGLGGELTPVVLGVLVALLGGYVMLGTYYAARTRGAESSLAAAISAVLLAFVVLGVITVQLLGLI
jgi:hypothetical protein